MYGPNPMKKLVGLRCNVVVFLYTKVIQGKLRWVEDRMGKLTSKCKFLHRGMEF